MISILTPTIRKDSLDIVSRCLKRQTHDNYEWIIISPYKYISTDDRVIWVQEPTKKKGDFYGLNKAWNAGLRIAQGELIISIVDLLWFPPDTLERLWFHYVNDNMSCIGLGGHQYERIEHGKPEGLVWRDPRIQSDETFYKIPGYDLELCIASLPKKGIYDVGGFDEQYDKAPAWSEKELACRMEAIGYRCFLDTSIEYRAIRHERLTKTWDEFYPISTQLFNKHYKEIQQGSRKRLDYI